MTNEERIHTLLGRAQALAGERGWICSSIKIGTWRPDASEFGFEDTASFTSINVQDGLVAFQLWLQPTLSVLWPTRLSELDEDGELLQILEALEADVAEAHRAAGEGWYSYLDIDTRYPGKIVVHAIFKKTPQPYLIDVAELDRHIAKGIK